MPTEAYIYDAIRTPRGRGKANGSLHEVRPLDLLKTLFDELRVRHDLDTSQVDDVLLGCVTPVKEQGGNIARTAPLYAGWDLDLPGAQLNRFCASGLEAVNLAAMKVRSGWEDLIVAGGVESMSRVPMGSDGGAMWDDYEVMGQLDIVPQGISADRSPRWRGSPAPMWMGSLCCRSSARPRPRPTAISVPSSPCATPPAMCSSTATSIRGPTRRWRGWRR